MAGASMPGVQHDGCNHQEPEPMALSDRRIILLVQLGILLSLGRPVSVSATELIRLTLPLRCEIGRTCFIQHHVDLDPSPGTQDFNCGSATYNDHDGVDFRVLSAAAALAGIEVVAPADGRVLRMRDGIIDAFARSRDRAAVGNQECGNGLVIDHGGGLETQYCHLLKGSLVVSPGQTVGRGASLGKVGYSGLADFAHLHFTVRKNGRIIDPFSGLPGGRNAEARNTCAPAPAAIDSVWQTDTAGALAYRPAELIQVGFSSGIPDWQALEENHADYGTVHPISTGLVVFGRAINLNGGDRLRFSIEGPAGFRVDQTSAPIDRHKAIYVAGAGKRLTGARWPSGTYRGTVQIVRDGTVIATTSTELMLQ